MPAFDIGEKNQGREADNVSTALVLFIPCLPCDVHPQDRRYKGNWNLGYKLNSQQSALLTHIVDVVGGRVGGW